MAVSGAKPKPDGKKVTRHPLTQEWVDVQDVPYAGDVPDPGRLAKLPARWWRTISRMPHCVLWSESDWQFALDTLVIYRRFLAGKEGGSELRIREKQMGTTIDARRDLRIRYVGVPETQEEVKSAPTDFASARRARIMGSEAGD